MGDTRKVFNLSQIEADADKDLLHVSKHLLDSAELKVIGRFDGEIRRFLYDICLPFEIGIHLLPGAALEVAEDRLPKVAPCLKSIEDATEMRRRIFTAFENAELESASGNSPWLTFVIVGGGPTGVELAGALSEIARKTLKDDFRSIRPDQAQLILVDKAPRLLPTFSENLAGKAERALLQLGVRVRCGVNRNEPQLPDTPSVVLLVLDCSGALSFGLWSDRMAWSTAELDRGAASRASGSHR